MQPPFTRTASRGNNCRYAEHRWVRCRKECACGSMLNPENSTFNVEISPRIKILPERSCCTTSRLVPATTRFAVNQAPHRNVRRERGLPADADVLVLQSRDRAMESAGLWPRVHVAARRS